MRGISTEGESMKKQLSTLLFTTTMLAAFDVSAGVAQVKVIYGADNRVDADETTNPMYLRLSESTAAMIPNSRIKEHNNMQVELVGRTLSQNGMCESERFSGQLAVGNCSGFLVAPNKLVTAGHCVQTEFDCNNSSWVFDYKADSDNQSEFVLDKSVVYKCKAILSQSLDSSTQNDYALLELDREVTDRSPLKFRTGGKPKVGDPLVVIGHPSGLPTKIADGANVRSVNDVFLTSNLDTYGGNSGSAVFNAETGIVEGILVRGEQDYVFDSSQGCRVSNIVADNEGRGEDVTLITQVKGLEEIEQPSEPQEPTEPQEPQQPSEPDQPSDEPSDDPSDEPNEPEEPLSFWEWLLRWLSGQA